MSSISLPVAVFVVDLLRGYGSERYTVQLVNALASKGVAVDLLFQIEGNSLINDVDPRVHKVNIGTRNPFSTVYFLYRYLRTVQPRALFTTMEKPSLLGLVAGILADYHKVVPTMHVDINAYANQEHSERRKILRILVSLLYRFAPVVVAVSQGVAKALQSRIGAQTRIVTILNGFDLVSLRHRGEEKTAFSWLARKKVPVVIGCGRFVPIKGFDVLIKAFAKVRKETDSRLIILGEGELRDDLQKLIKKLGIQDDVALPGYAENPQAWLAQSDVFVLSSRSEGFGNVLVEALVSGIAVVSTDCPSGPRDILDGGRYGTLVPVDDVEAMASAIQQAFVHRPDADTVSKIQSYLDSHFSSQAMAESYLALVESLEA